MAKKTNKKDELSLESILWNCRVALRGYGSTEKNRDAVIGLVFLKFAGDKYEERYQEIAEEYPDILELREMPASYNAKNVYYLQETSRWSYIVENASSNDIAIIIDTAMKDIEDDNPSLKGTLPQNLYATLGAPASKIKSLIDEVNKIDKDRFHEEDLIGRVYEYFLQIYAASGTKDDGEFYTPVSIVKLLTELIEPYDGVVYDPCCGSGHILVYAFDVLLQIYESCGYSQRDAAKSIAENNLYGLDIDNRAYQLAYFAVMMKARQYNRRILNGETICHLYAIQESNDIDRNQLKYFGSGLSEMEKNTASLQLQGLLDTFTDAKEYGSILKVENYNWELLHRYTDSIDANGQMSLDSIGVEFTRNQIRLIVEIGKVISNKYDVVITNPPYMGSNRMGGKLSEHVKEYYPDSKSDLFAVFIQKGLVMTKHCGYSCMVTMQSWMFLSSFEKLRIGLVNSKTISTLMHMENMVMGIAFGTAVSNFRNCNIKGYRGTYNHVSIKNIGEDELPKEFPIKKIDLHKLVQRIFPKYLELQ